MAECPSCGAHVTEDFGRVFGDNQNQIDGCRECMTATDIMKGHAAAARPTPAITDGGQR